MSVADSQSSPKQPAPKADTSVAEASAVPVAPKSAVSDPPAMSREQLAILAAAFAAVAVVYWRSILALVGVWEIDPNYSHGYVVPFFALGLAWIAYTRHNVAPVNDSVPRGAVIVGSIEIAAGLLLHLFSTFLGDKGLFLDVIALIFILLGVIMVLGGKTANKVYGFPVFFLIFMAPLPAMLYNKMALPLQQFASIAAVNLFDMCGIPADRSGYRIEIPGDHVMLVGEACSGLRSLTAILALAFAIAYLSGRSMSYRALLVALAGPVAIAVNCLRVFGTGLIMMYIGPEWATGAAHEYEGMVMIGVAASLLVLLAWLMGELEDWLREKKQAAKSEAVSDAPQPA